MCGILGLYSNNKIDNKNFNNALAVIKYRGPDETKKIQHNNFTLGFNRLSIIGINNILSSQPIETKDYIISFNGEIFNYKEIAKKLNIGFSKSKSDSYVLSKLIQKYGELKFIKYLDGMFAISIFVKKKNKIYLYRDRIGEKNFFYSLNKNNFAFSSEIKPLLKLKIFKKEVNLKNIHEYFYHGMIFENGETFFNNIYQVDPGSYVSIDCNSFKLKKINYFKINEKTNYKSDVKTELDKSLLSRLVADVKIGILLSGGLDSSFMLSRLIKRFLKKTYVFTAGNNSKEKDETPQAKQTIKFLKKKYPYVNLNHKILRIDKKNNSNELIKLSKYYDQPLHLPHSDLLFNICKNVRKTGFKVLYGGEGLDEIAYGYKRFFRTLNEIKKNKKNMNNKIDLIYFGAGLKNIQLISKILKRENYNYKNLQSYKFVSTCLKNYSIYKTQMLFSIKYKLQTLLYRNDRIGMINSVEMRSPFIRPKLMQYFLSLKSTVFFNEKHNEGKLPIRNLSKNQIPQNIIKNIEKKRFYN